jgi:ABC-type taurine transport system substrate-binding protein
VKYVVLTGLDEGRRAAAAAQELGAHWARLGDQTVVWAEPDLAPDVTNRLAREASATGREAEGHLYLVIQVGRDFQNAFPRVRTVIEKGRYLVVDLRDDEVEGLAGRVEDDWMVRPLPADRVIFDLARPAARAMVPWVQALVDAVSQTTFAANLTWLAGLHTRHSLSPDFVQAANWAAGQLADFGYQASLQPITVGSGHSSNVVADRQGRGAGGRGLVLVTAHLDSINIAGGAGASAPGADDNGSGSAGLLEMARVLATHPSEHDLRLILFGGEEEGLHGSTQYVAALPPSERARIRGIVNMDMIATVNTATPTVMLEGATISQGVMDQLGADAATYTSLGVQTSLHPFASDHVPFINALMPAVLTIEGSDSANGNIHSANDTLAHIDYGLALGILRMNVATAATLLGIAATPRGSGPVVAWGPNRLDVFVIGTDSALYHKWWDGAAWGPSVTDYEYMGGVCASPPEVVAWGPNRLDVFVIGTDLALYHKWWDGAAWGPSVTGWEYMGGVCTSPPKVVAWGPNRLDVFVIGTDSALYHKWWDGAAWGPSVTDYEYMGGVCASPPEVVSWGSGRLDVFLLGTDHALYHKWYDGGWGPSVTDYEYMGGVCTSPPKVVAWGSGRLDVFLLGTDHALYHKWYDGGWGPSVTDYEYMGGVCTSPPEVVAWASGRLDVFVLGTDHALYHKWYEGGWGPSVTDYEYMGGVCTDGPKVVAWASGRLDAFVIGTDSALYHKWYGGAWGPSVTDYETMGGVITAF